MTEEEFDEAIETAKDGVDALAEEMPVLKAIEFYECVADYCKSLATSLAYQVGK